MNKIETSFCAPCNLASVHVILPLNMEDLALALHQHIGCWKGLSLSLRFCDCQSEQCHPADNSINHPRPWESEIVGCFTVEGAKVDRKEKQHRTQSAKMNII